MRQRVCIYFIAPLLVSQIFAQENPSASPKAAVGQLIPWLLDEQAQLRGIPFGELIADVAGKKVLPFDPKNEVDRRVLKGIKAASDAAMTKLNAPNSAIQTIARIN